MIDCAFCQTPFAPPRRDSVYCCARCAFAAAKARDAAAREAARPPCTSRETCLICDAPIPAQRRRKPNVLYCSPTCAREAEGKHLAAKYRAVKPAARPFRARATGGGRQSEGCSPERAAAIVDLLMEDPGAADVWREHTT